MGNFVEKTNKQIRLCKKVDLTTEKEKNNMMIKCLKRAGDKNRIKCLKCAGDLKQRNIIQFHNCYFPEEG